MKEKLKRIISSFEKFWFSDMLMGMFIIFPSGMWTIMILMTGMFLMEHQFPCNAIFSLLFFCAGLFTILFGMKREWNKIKSKKH